METCRGAFSETILEKAKNDRDIIVVCTDSRGSASLGSYPKEVPEQFVEMGIAEQNAVSVSAGMAKLGKKLFVIGPASFYSMRAAEQIKVDLACSQADVKVIGISGGISYGALGATHHSLQDIALMRTIPGLVVEIPADANQMRGLTDALLARRGPAYVRIGRGAVPNIYERSCKVEIGKAIRLQDGNDAAIFACGQMVWRALEAEKLLREKGVEARVYDMHTIKPLDKEAILEAAKECGCILSVEEHSIYGGLGGTIAEVVAGTNSVPMQIMGIPDEDVPNGKDSEVFDFYHINPTGIAAAVKRLMSQKR